MTIQNCEMAAQYVDVGTVEFLLSLNMEEDILIARAGEQSTLQHQPSKFLPFFAIFMPPLQKQKRTGLYRPFLCHIYLLPASLPACQSTMATSFPAKAEANFYISIGFHFPNFGVCAIHSSLSVSSQECCCILLVYRLGP